MRPAVSKGGWWSRRGIRARSTIVAVLAVALALLAGGAFLAVVLRVVLTNTVAQAVEQRARDVAAEVADEDVEGAGPTIDAAPGDTALVQVLSSSGKVLISSKGILGEPPIVSGADATRDPQTHEVDVPFVDGSPYLAAVMAVDAKGEPVTVVTAQSLAPIRDAYRTVVTILIVGLPLLLLAVGSITWLVVGRGLASVDRIRSRVETIGGQDLHERVPVPVARDQIARLAETMNHMLERLESSAASQRQFVADASHELRSPLASMRVSLDVGRLEGSEGWDATEEVLSDEVDRMTRLVDDLLLLARADEGGLDLRFEDVDLDDLVLEEASRLRTQRLISVSTQLSPARVRGDRGRLAQALRNLVDNAARYAVSQVRLTVTSDGRLAVVRVEDDGPGIPQDVREAVLRRFVRVDEHRARDDGGSGLGLAITRELVDLHHGTLRIDDSTLGGAQLSIELPTSGFVADSR